MIDTIDTWGFDNQSKIKEPWDFTSLLSGYVKIAIENGP